MHEQQRSTNCLEPLEPPIPNKLFFFSHTIRSKQSKKIGLFVYLFDCFSDCLSAFSSVNLSVFPSFRLSVSLSVFVSLRLSVSRLSVSTSVHLSVCLSVGLSVILFVRLSLPLSVFPPHFIRILLIVSKASY